MGPLRPCIEALLLAATLSGTQPPPVAQASFGVIFEMEQFVGPVWTFPETEQRYDMDGDSVPDLFYVQDSTAVVLRPDGDSLWSRTFHLGEVCENCDGGLRLDAIHVIGQFLPDSDPELLIGFDAAGGYGLVLYSVASGSVVWSVHDLGASYYSVLDWTGDGLLEILLVRYLGGSSYRSELLGFLSGSGSTDSVPSRFLPGVAPNPSRGSAVMKFMAADAGKVDVEILDAAGRAVRHLTQVVGGPGRCDVHWDGRDDAGRPVAAGAYFAKMTAKDRTESRRMVIVR